MARMRAIKPGIMTNEELCELGPYAYILFTGLWMIADREGRLEDRPKRIKMETMPFWEEVTFEAVENLLKNLHERGFIHRYEVNGKRCIYVVKWNSHQRPHVNEAASVLPPPPANSPAINDLPPALPMAVQSTTIGDALPGGNGNGNYNGAPPSGGVRARERTLASPVEISPSEAVPPPLKTRNTEHGTPTPRRAASKVQPARKPRSPVDPQRTILPGGSPDEPAPKQQPERKPPRRATAWNHPAYGQEDFNTLRESLNELANAVRMNPPDDGLVGMVLDAAQGAPVLEICRLLVALWKRNKFRSMYSWGFVPHLVRDAAHIAAASA